MEEVAVVGDGLNDVDMLGHKGVRVGVHGGRDEIIEIAEFLIPPPEQGGWERIPDLIETLAEVSVAVVGGAWHLFVHSCRLVLA